MVLGSDSRPPWAVEVFGRGLCGVVASALNSGDVDSDAGKVLYTVLSDEVIDTSADYRDPANRRHYVVAGRPGLDRGDRIHAYVSRRPARVSMGGRDVQAYLLRWYEHIYTIPEGCSRLPDITKLTEEAA